MKYLLLETFDSLLHCRSPCGERGLKLLAAAGSGWRLWSLPVRGAWIEMVGIPADDESDAVAPRAGSVD